MNKRKCKLPGKQCWAAKNSCGPKVLNWCVNLIVINKVEIGQLIMDYFEKGGEYVRRS